MPVELQRDKIQRDGTNREGEARYFLCWFLLQLRLCLHVGCSQWARRML